MRPSMGSRGDAYDNAMAESFFSTLEAELLAKHRFESPSEAQLTVFRYIEGWYNPYRRHSALGQRSPLRFEQAYLSPETPTPSRRLNPQAAPLHETGTTTHRHRSALQGALSRGSYRSRAPCVGLEFAAARAAGH